MNPPSFPRVELTCRNSRAVIQMLSPRMLRITHLAPGEAQPPERSWFHQVLMPLTPPDPQNVRFHPQVLDGCLRILDREDTVRFAEGLPAVVKRDGHSSVGVSMEAGEGFYGLGEWFNAFRRERGKVTLKIAESPAVFQTRQTYSTIPLLWSSRGYAFFLLNSYRSTWDFQPEHQVMRLEVDAGPLDYVVILGETPREILSEYTALTGRPPLLPRWAFGLWLTSYPQEHQERVVEMVREHRQREIPLDAVILDYHWEERFHNFRWRSRLFPDPEQMIFDLKMNHVRLGLIFTPFVNNVNQPWKKFLFNMLVKNLSKGAFQEDERALPEYEEANRSGYLAHPKAEWWFGGGGMVDYTNPQAVAWWNKMLEPLYDQGVDFFKNDDGEYLPEDAHSFSGMDGREYHNLYGFFYGKALYEGMAKLDQRRPLIYARSVWAGSQRYPALFLGDQKPTFHHIRATIWAGLNMSLAGFAYWTADCFGLDGKTTPETHMRYAQWALMVPIARYFQRPAGVDDTRSPWSHSSQVEENFRRIIELRYRLLPYYCNLAWDAWQNGWPLMRPLFMEFPQDTELDRVDDQVMLGGDLLLAPVTEADAQTRDVLLPEGDWFDFWTEKHYQGGQTITVDVTLDTLPLFVRGGAIIPMTSAREYIADGAAFDPLEFHFYPPFEKCELVMHEDDGVSRAYQNGEVCRTPLCAIRTGTQIEIVLGAPEGKYAGQPDRRMLIFVLHGVDMPATVRFDQEPAPGWVHDPEKRILKIPVHLFSHLPHHLLIYTEGKNHRGNS